MPEPLTELELEKERARGRSRLLSGRYPGGPLEGVQTVPMPTDPPPDWKPAPDTVYQATGRSPARWVGPDWKTDPKLEPELKDYLSKAKRADGGTGYVFPTGQTTGPVAALPGGPAAVGTEAAAPGSPETDFDSLKDRMRRDYQDARRQMGRVDPRRQDELAALASPQRGFDAAMLSAPEMGFNPFSSIANARLYAGFEDKRADLAAQYTTAANAANTEAATRQNAGNAQSRGQLLGVMAAGDQERQRAIDNARLAELGALSDLDKARLAATQQDKMVQSGEREGGAATGQPAAWPAWGGRDPAGNEPGHPTGHDSPDEGRHDESGRDIV